MHQFYTTLEQSWFSTKRGEQNKTNKQKQKNKKKTKQKKKKNHLCPPKKREKKRKSKQQTKEKAKQNRRAISKKMALFWDLLSTQKAKFQIWYLSEFLVVLWPKYVVINKTTLGILKNGQIKFFVKISNGLCA